jgi:hypothetical protein
MITQAIAWGNNANGNLNLPNGTLVENLNFASGFYGVTRMAAGTKHSVALTNWGQVIAWGNGNDFGQKDIPESFNFNPIDIAVDQNTTYILGDDGTVTGYGEMYYFGKVPRLTGIKNISVNSSYGLGLTYDNRITGWGDDYFGRTSGGNNLTGVKGISAGWNHAVAILQNNNITGWGSSGNGRLSFPSVLANIYDIYATDYSTITFHTGSVSGIQIWGGTGVTGIPLLPRTLPTGVTGILDASISDSHGLLLTSTILATDTPPKPSPTPPPCVTYYYDYDMATPTPTPTPAPSYPDIVNVFFTGVVGLTGTVQFSGSSEQWLTSLNPAFTGSVVKDATGINLWEIYVHDTFDIFYSTLSTPKTGQPITGINTLGAGTGIITW